MSEWISVKDRLPEAGVTVIVSSPCGITCAYYYDETMEAEATGYEPEPLEEWLPRNIGWYEIMVCDNSDTMIRNITHWMPLPELPEQPEEDVEETGFLMQRFMRQE